MCLHVIELDFSFGVLLKGEENMNNLFVNGTPQQIPEVLANRDRRVALQNQLT